MPSDAPTNGNGPRRGPRGVRQLAGDAGWQELLTALGSRLYRILGGRSIASCARSAGISHTALEDAVNTRTDPKLSTLYRVARARGYRVQILFAPLLRGDNTPDN